jgi:hypothetical protein
MARQAVISAQYVILLILGKNQVFDWAVDISSTSNAYLKFYGNDGYLRV